VLEPEEVEVVEVLEVVGCNDEDVDVMLAE